MASLVSFENINVKHGAGAYDVVFTTFADAMSALPRTRVFVTDENVWACWGRALPDGARVFQVPAGEGSKCLARFSSLIESLALVGADRGTTLVAIGGGVVGDLAGFVAATYMRGIPYVQVPTSLLAQVDSSVGGKVAVDMPQGKNLVGAFYPPEKVFVASDVLDTLPRRQFANGMAEVWKYAFILDSSLADALLTPTRDTEMQSVIRRCIELKAAVVEDDELDRSGRRAVLNFGHTVGHALEQLTGYGPLLHGEAVAIGMVAEARLGERIGLTAPGTADFVRRCLAAEGLPVGHEMLASTALLEAMSRDKKAEAGVPGFSLLTRVGECKLVAGISPDVVREALK